MDEANPEEYEAVSGLDVRAMADPNCRICGGLGEIPRVRADSYSTPEVCICVEKRNRMRTAEMMVERRFPHPLSTKTFANYDDGGKARNKLAADALMRFVDKFDMARGEGWIIGLTGDPSAAKTHLAIATAIYAIKRWLADARMVNVNQLMKLTDKNARDLMDQAVEADLLILDDIGAQHEARVREGKYDTNWQDQRLYDLLNDRINAGRPTIYTTNLSKAAFEEKLSARVRARIERAEVASFPLIQVAEKAAPNKKRLNFLLGTEDEHGNPISQDPAPAAKAYGPAPKLKITDTPGSQGSPEVKFVSAQINDPVVIDRVVYNRAECELPSGGLSLAPGEEAHVKLGKLPDDAAPRFRDITLFVQGTYDGKPFRCRFKKIQKNSASVDGWEASS